MIKWSSIMRVVIVCMIAYSTTHVYAQPQLAGGYPQSPFAPTHQNVKPPEKNPDAAPRTSSAKMTAQMPNSPVASPTAPPPPPATQPMPPQQATTTPTQEFERWLQNNGYGAPPESQTNAPPVATFALNAPPSQPPSTQSTQTPPAQIPPPPHRLRKQPLTYEQGQAVMLESAPPADLPISDEQTAAFNAMLHQNTPLSPQQIVKLRQHIDRSQRAAAMLPNIPPKPVSSTLLINLAPGATPPAIRLAKGYVSSLVFVDSTGAPWPIAAFDVGSPAAVNIQWDQKSNILLIQALQPYSDGDIVIRLVGLPTPITLQLVAGQPVVDFRVDVHVTGIGPNTKELPIGTPLPGSANLLLLGILDGIGPPGSRPLVVQGADAQAWILGARIYLRTRLTVLSPGWIGTMVSPDGMHAYELPKTSSVLVSRYGEPVALRIGGL